MTVRAGYTPSAFEALKPAVRTEPESGIVRVANRAWGRPDVIKLWVGEGDLPTPSFICDAATRAMANGETFYTWQRGIPPLREALARYHERLYDVPCDPGNFYVTHGGMQAIHLALQAIAGAGDQIVIPSPAWPNYPAPLRMLQVEPVEVPLGFSDGAWQLDLDRLFDAVTEKTRAIALNSPSNPLGKVVREDELIAVRDFCRRRGIWLLGDEVYARFYYPGPGDNRQVAPSLLECTDPEERLILANTFSKNWAMTGWRIGWMQAPKKIGQQIENLVQYNTSGVTSFAQPAAVVALDEGEPFLAEQIERARGGLNIVLETLGARDDVQFQEPEGAFYFFFRVDGLDSSEDTINRMIDEAGVGLAPGTAFGPGGDGWFRICFARSHDSLRQAMERLCNWLDGR
ncbi:MAG: pyridoxal phosphate-dependent aminotransferase [Pseudomonadota bacterium]